MKKFLFLPILFMAFFMMFFVTSSQGADNFKEFYNKGIEFYKQGKYDQAGKEFNKAIELKPNDVYALYGLGNTYYCKAKYDDAVKVYTKAININPDYAKVHYSLSLAYSKLGMTREAEKQKTMFRKLSQGGKSGGSSSHTKASHTSSHAKVEHTPKKSLSHAPKKSLHETKRTDTHAASGHQAKTQDTHAASGHQAKTQDTHAASGHQAKTQDTHAASGHQAKTQDTHAASGHQAKTQDTHAANKHDGRGSSNSIFKGYSGETHEADKRVFKNKSRGTYSFSKKPYSRVKYFIQDKWFASGINKIWICTAGYLFGIQIWLCVVAFFCLVLWRIREKA
ncbi:tetratricopeptide repeat protein [Candidatus Scalindua japonica]|nr:tetratricopeptide repeat protein [Candidatus Scalindua japonica]